MTDAVNVCSVASIVAALNERTLTAGQVLERTWARMDATEPQHNALTQRLRERAAQDAAVIDRQRADGVALPPLAGVPYVAKDLFDVAGIPTGAGSRVLKQGRPASDDAVLIQKLTTAGAVLTALGNMDEFAYGFTTENSHYGATRNPADADRVAGGSSGGSAAAVASGMVPFALGSDTNGSIRVPSSFCGVFGIKPTFGRLSRRGAYPFVADLDHVGPFARSTLDLAMVYDALQGHDPFDPASVDRVSDMTVPDLERGIEDLRIGVLGGYFDEWAGTEAQAAVAHAVQVLGVERSVTWPRADLARASAFLITGASGGALHREHVRDSYEQLEPLSRDRLIAGLLQPASWFMQAQRFRRWFFERVMESFADVDVLIAPATPCCAPLIDSSTVEINGQLLPARAAAGLLTQPVSFIGLPVVAAPVNHRALGIGLPIGLQLIAPPWRESWCLRVAAALEASGAVSAVNPNA
ncbi:AtzE family amidohydrolase [Caballeronia mineralivorans]|uniref:AtzE family amidohydrolase n=1 Tax=Caballeronia mineralivorans TaxID=2010198 RepID=UPI002AFF69A0|nr:AtzE family amidohydrolase [Caballeronia mineralivorans]MEA3097892.1 1-carboxybiuret hydrolase [Caballeronia mineralivorans]